MVVAEIRIDGEASWLSAATSAPIHRAAFQPLPPPPRALRKLDDAGVELGGLQIEIRLAGDWFTEVVITNKNPRPVGLYLADARIQTNFYPDEHAVWKKPTNYFINNKPAYPTSNTPLPPTPSPVWLQPGDRLNYPFLTYSIETPYGRSSSWGLVTAKDEPKILASSLGHEVILRIPVIDNDARGMLQLKMRSAQERARTQLPTKLF